MVLLSLTACPPPTEEECAGPAADDAGVVGPIAGFPAAGQRLRRTVSAPVTTCRTSVNATVEVFAPGNVRAEGVVENVTFAPASFTVSTRSVALATVSFTPNVPGAWTVNVNFDGLGIRTFSVDVLPTSSESDGTPFTLPAGVTECPRGPWVLSNLTHGLCEQNSNSTIAVFPLDGDGGVTVIPGQHLVVVEDVAWFLTGDGTQLQRYVWDAGQPGGLQLTDRWDGFNNVRVRGEHSRTRAVRGQSTNAVRVVEAATSVDLAVSFFGSELTSSIFTFQPETMTIEADPASAVHAVEPRVKWVRDFSMPSASSVLLMHRNAGTVGGGIPMAVPALPRTAQLEPFERIPMWIPTSGGIVYLKQGASGLETSVWPANTALVRAAEHFVVLQQADGGPNFYVVPR